MTQAAPPAGSVTLMFTDIEGSTKLLERLRERYALVLEQQRDILRAAFERHAGHEVDTQGDSFFVAFASAAEALACAVEIQRDLAAHDWPDGVQLKVRIGVHTGQPAIAATGYVGIDVHRGARIGAAANGGQVLTSAATREAVVASPPGDVELESLGIFRFKGLADPLAVFEVHAPGLATDFPPIRTSPPEDEPPAAGEAPYKGLLRFEEEDADRFFGREQLVSQVVASLEAGGFLAVIGASGSGKSSLVRAGVIPALKARHGARVAVMTPSAAPAGELAKALRRKPTVLVVDQLEELFTLCREDDERRQFVARLMAAVDGGLPVLATLRADFYAGVGDYDALRQAIADNQLYIGPMDLDGLRRAIEEPARRGGWDIAPGLVDLLLRDVGSEPGALPLLSHALLETWSRRRGSRMTLKGYFESGEVRGAIARTADRLYADLAASEQQEAREILLRLTELGEGTQDTRRRAHLDELPSADVLARLVDARLVTVDEGNAEVAHEALIREWPLLRTWLHEDREGLRTQRQITESTQEWETLNREPSLLFRGARLATAHEWADAHPRSVTARERAFIDASMEAEEADQREREAQQQRALDAERRRAEEQAAANKRLRRRAVFLAGLVVVAGVLGVAAVVLAGQASDQASLARQQANTALSRQLAAQAANSRDANLDLSLLLSVEALRFADTVEARATLLSGVLSEPQLDTVVAKIGRVSTSAFTPDGRWLAVADGDAVRVWDLANLQVTATISTAANANSIALSTDATTLVASSGSLDTPSTTAIYDVSTGALLSTFQACPSGAGTVNPTVTAMIISCSSEDGQSMADAHLVSLPSGTEIGPLCLVGQAQFTPDGSRIAIVCDGAINVYDTTNGQVIRSIAVETAPEYVVPSDDGSAVLAAYSVDEGGSVVVWDVSSGRQLGTVSESGTGRFVPGHVDQFMLATEQAIELWTVGQDAASASFDCPQPQAGVFNLAFDEQGSRVAGVCQSGIQVLSMPDLSSIATLRPPGMNFASTGNSVGGLAFQSAGELTSLTLNDFAGEATIAAWAIDRKARIAQPFGAPPPADQIVLAVSPDLTKEVMATSDTTRLWLVSMPSGENIGAPIDVPTTDVGTFVGFTADSRLLAIGALKLPEVSIVDAADGHEVARFPGTGDGVYNWAFSSDGSRIAVGSLDSLIVWDIASKAKLHTFDQRGDLPTAFSPDDKVFAIAEGRTVTLWDADAWGRIGSIAGRHEGNISNVIFSPDGATLATTSTDQTVLLWDVNSREQKGTPLRQNGAIYTGLFSPDSSLLATFEVFGRNTGATLWDVGLHQVIGTLPDSFPMAFSPSGQLLVTNGSAGPIAWAMGMEAWTESACATANRNLTQDEWARYLGDQPYHETCFEGTVVPSPSPASPAPSAP